ncbi:isomerizing glutamine--fructose-6-phosphate transaminase [Paenibacillus sp. P26]|nr:isomerizing glutamine--fructose-6-phosphate transaminase [Paenibacillus sp. P26]
MCGIVGYIGNRDSQNILLEGLKKLEYRGYDSAGVAIHTSAGLALRKAKGRISELETQLEAQPLTGFAGIGHTRWATHGKPSDANSHPHTDNDMKISVVHNGIIENHLRLKEELEQLGYRFVSETDTEVLSHLIAHHYEGDLVQAVRKAVSQVRGAYAIAVLSEHEPDKLVAVRWASPLIIGVGQGENFIGSDIPAILEYTRDVYILNDGEMAVLTRDSVELMTLEGNFIAKRLFRVDWDLMQAEKNGFDTFMLKEIHERPRAYQDTMRGRIDTRAGRSLYPACP